MSVRRNKAGFQIFLKVIGNSETDKEFKERVAKNQKEIDEFIKKHPYLSYKRDRKLNFEID